MLALFNACHNHTPAPTSYFRWDDGSELTMRERRVHGEGPFTWHCGEQLPVVPKAGRMLVFGQGRNAGLAHEAQDITCTHDRMEDMKWILRSDVCYVLVRKN